MKIDNLSQAKKEAVESFLNAIIDNKAAIADFAGIRNYDTAYPVFRSNEIRMIFPEFNGTFMVYNYDNNRVFGSFTNVAEESITKLVEILNTNEQEL